MTGLRAERLALQCAKAAVAAGAAYFLLVYVGIAVSRLTFPFELEWMEGGSVAQVQRILDGKPIYVAPSLEFIPYIYTPLYYYAGTIAAKLLGNGFLPLRLISFLASLGCLGLVFARLRARSFPLPAVLASCGLFAATFRIAGGWFDIARVDSLFLFFLLAGVLAFESPRFSINSLLAPALLFLSFFTKQSALIPALFMAVAAPFVHGRREGLCFAAIFGALVVCSSWLMNHLTGGWYGYYVFDLPAQHQLLREQLSAFWLHDLALHLPIALALCAAAFKGMNPAQSIGKRELLDLAVLGGFILTSYLSRLHSGGYDNVLMPAYAAIAMLFGAGLSGIPGTSKCDVIATAAWAAAAAQFVLLWYPPGQQVPSAQDRIQGQRLERLVSSFSGEVYLSDHPWYAGRLGKATQAQDMAVRDILRAPSAQEQAQTLAREMNDAIEHEKYDALVVDFPLFTLRPRALDKHYALMATDLSAGFLHPVTGWDRRPSLLYVRRSLLMPDSKTTDTEPPAAPPSP